MLTSWSTVKCLLLLSTCLMYVPKSMVLGTCSFGLVMVGMEFVVFIFTRRYVCKEYIETKTPTPIIRSTRASLRACQERALSSCLRRSDTEFSDFVGMANSLLCLRIIGVLGVDFKRKPQEFGFVTPRILLSGQLKTPVFGGVDNDG